ncbi:diguanylate cyclase [Musicola paradisiaca Ech703]|uniref:diguanylate cyclase n=2 Tax=Musicola paradisiaca TaxID=69223 RepID=C6CDM3_MUSP7|nr:diguanylate cyclase [Musicola paradisiaca Ech703]
MFLNLSLFKNGKIFSNSVNLFILTLVGCIIGAHARLSAIDMSVFWPVNIIIAAVFYRCRYLNTIGYYFVVYVAMIIQDTFFYGWGISAFTINAANIIFIFTLNQLLTRPAVHPRHEQDIASSLYTFIACLLAAFCCAVVGALAQSLPVFSQAQWRDNFLNWFSDQFYTSVLFLPLLLTVRSNIRLRIPALNFNDILPILFLAASLIVGAMISPLAILAFPLPALTWCAIVYPLWLTRLITLCTGTLQLIVSAEHVYAIYSGLHDEFTNQVVITRISIAAIIFSPLFMAMNAKTIRLLNKRLLLQASYDFLTNTLSRYGFNEALTNYGKEERYRNVSVNIMLIDIDHFKHINDSFGHDCGDEVLKQVAAIIKDTINEQGLISRIGGEEFAVVCFDYSPDAFYWLADKLRRRIYETTFMFNQSPVPVAISIGLAHASSPNGDLLNTVHQLCTQADKNLYAAKRQGRNQTVQ